MRRFLAWLALSGVIGASSAQEAPPMLMSAPERAATAGCEKAYAGPSSRHFDRIQQNQSVWLRDKRSDTVVIFVHGIASDNVGAWLTAAPPKCTYWPDLLASDTSYFSDVDIFVAGYYSQADSGSLEITDVAGQLFTAIASRGDDQQLAPLYRKNIIFLSHSLGGIVVREMLQQKRAYFAQHKIAVALLGSPTKGSDYAKLIGDWLGTFYSNALLRDLKSGAPALAAIDANFKVWLAERKAAKNPVAVAEFFESTFPKKDCGFLWWGCDWISVEMPEIVALNSTANYGGDARRIGNTDHLTLVKPTVIDGGIHQEIRRFFDNSFTNGRRLYGKNYGTVKVDGATQTMDWQRNGEASEWVISHLSSCGADQQQEGCEPKRWNVGNGFSALNPVEGSTGFVVLRDHVRSSRPQDFRVTDVYSPDPSLAKFDGKPVYYSLHRSVAYHGQGQAEALFLKTMQIQPVAFLANRKPLPSIVKDIPATHGEKLTLEIPAATRDAQLSIASIAGDWSVPVPF